MASRAMAARSIMRRMSSSGKVLSEEEKAVENVYIKKLEQEKLDKLAKKGVSSQAAAQDTKVQPATQLEGNTPKGSNAGTSTDKNRNYAVLAGTVAIVSGLGWYLLSKPKESDEVHH